MCRQSGTAELCLVGGPSSYSLEAEGLQANSEATVSMVGGGSPMVVPIDAAGRVASEAGRVGVLGGPDPQKMIVTGTTSDGNPAEFEFTVPAIHR